MSLRLRLQLEQAAEKSGLAPDLILQFVSRAWISPLEPSGPLFDEEDLARARLIQDLRERMGVNDDAVPVILHLVDQLNRFHLELKDRGHG